MFTYSGTSTTEPTDKYIQPAPRNDKFFVVGRYNRVNSTVLFDYGSMPFNVERSAVGFYRITFAVARPLGSYYCFAVKGGRFVDVVNQTSTYVDIVVMDEALNYIDDMINFHVV